MRCKGSLRIDGTIEANLHCAELVIGENAVIVGSIAANKVAVSGGSMVRSLATTWCYIRRPMSKATSAAVH